MESQNNKLVEIIDNLNEDEYGLAVDVNTGYVLGKTEKINYDYIKSKEIKSFENYKNNIKKDFLYIEFDRKFSLSLLEILGREIENLLISEDISICNAVVKIIELFQKSKFIKDIRNEILGDIGELLFIIKAKEKTGIDFQDQIRSNDNSLYDFKYGNKHIEVKSATKTQHDFKISFNQLNEVKNKILIISKFKIIEGEESIINLFDRLEPLCSFLKEKKQNWISKNEFMDIDILNKYTINFEKSNCFIFKENKLPIIKIEQEGAFKEMEITIDATESNIEDLSTLKEKINN